MRNKIALVVAVLLGLVAIFGVHQYSKSVQEKVAKTQVRVKVVAAAQQIRAGTTVTPNMLMELEIPSESITANSIMASSLPLLVGQRINQTVQRQEQLFWTLFRQPPERLEQRLFENERALALRADSISGVAGNIVPGSHVDIIGSFAVQGQGGASRSENKTVTLLNNVTVLAVDNRAREDDPSASGSTGQRQRGYSTVTVAVTPLEANVLVYAQQAGQITLTLRQPTDATILTDTLEVQSTNMETLAAKALAERSNRLKNRPAVQVLPLEE